MYRYVIAPNDGSTASSLAQQLAVELCVVFGSQLVVVTSTDTLGKGTLEALKGRAQELSNEHTYVRLDGMTDPAGAIEQAVFVRPDSILVMATHARDGASRLARGSVTETLLSRVDVPMVLVGPRCQRVAPGAARRLVVCVDGSDRDRAAVDLAAAWARALDLPCTVLYISEGGPFDGMDALAEELSHVSPAVNTVTITSTDVVGGIGALLERDGTAMAVMASHGRHGAGRLVHGSHVTGVLQRSITPVLVVRAPGR